MHIMECHKQILPLLLVTLVQGALCFRASCLNAGSSPNDSLTILHCSEDDVAIQWNIHGDLQFVAFEYSCIHPTNSVLSVRNQSLPFWNDGQTGVTMVSPPGGALCLFSACYLDNDNTRHFITPTSCSVTSTSMPPDDGSSLMEQIIVLQTATSISDIEGFPSTTPESSSSRAKRTAFPPQQVPPYLLPVGVAMLIIVALIFAALLLVGVKRRQRLTLQSLSRTHLLTPLHGLAVQTDHNLLE